MNPSNGAIEKARLEAARARLIEEKESLERELKEISDGNLEMLQSEMTGENAHDEHIGDSGTATFERERDLTLENNIKDLAGRVNAALEKIDKGTYGICDNCGAEIDPARLKAVPYANLCITCKTDEESRR